MYDTKKKNMRLFYKDINYNRSRLKDIFEIKRLVVRLIKEGEEADTPTEDITVSYLPLTDSYTVTVGPPVLVKASQGFDSKIGNIEQKIYYTKKRRERININLLHLYDFITVLLFLASVYKLVEST